MQNRQVTALNNSRTRRPMFAPRTRVTERVAVSPRTGRIEWVRKNGLALVQWTDGTKSHAVTFNLVRTGEREIPNPYTSHARGCDCADCDSLRNGDRS